MGMIILSHAAKKYGLSNTSLRLNWDKGAFDNAPKEIIRRGRTSIRMIDEEWLVEWQRRREAGELPARIRPGE